MVRVNWTLQSLDDLESISLFIARDSIHYARMFTQRVFSATQRLEIFPLSGRVVPEFDQESLREIVLDGYRVIYRVSGEMVDILAIHHGAREVVGAMIKML